MGESVEDIISNLRAIIISNKGGLKLTSVRADYQETFGVDVPMKALGCSNLEEFFRKHPKDFVVNGTQVQAVTKAASMHLASLVSRQKTAPRKGRHKLASRGAQRFMKPTKTISSNVKSNVAKQFPLPLMQQPLIPPLMQHWTPPPKNVKGTVKTPAPDPGLVLKTPRNNAGVPVPFAEWEELHGKGKKDNARKLILNNNNNNSTINNNNNNNTVTSNNKNAKGAGAGKKVTGTLSGTRDEVSKQNQLNANLSAVTSPFNKALANYSQQEIKSAKAGAGAGSGSGSRRRVQPSQPLTVTVSSDLSRDLDTRDYVKDLADFCTDRKLILPTYSVIIRETANRTRYYGCKVNMGDWFSVSTYPVETETETAARRLAAKKAHAQLLETENLSPFRDTESVIRLREVCARRNLPEPVFKSIECHPKNEPAYFICKVRIGQDILLSSYPFEAPDELAAKDVAAKKAHDHLTAASKAAPERVKTDAQVLSQIYDMIKTRDYGVWCNKLRDLYLDTYNEDLQPNWFDLVKTSSRFELESIAKAGCIIRASKASPTEVQRETCPEPGDLSPLKLPDSNQWEVYITNVVTSAEIWCRLIGTEFSEVYDAMMTKLELHPPTVTVKSPTVGQVYLVNLEESWNRVRLVEVYQEKKEAKVFLIDIGVEETVKSSQLFYLPREFFSVPPQAILLLLNELEGLAECEELQLTLFHSLLGNTFIAELVAILDDGANVSSVNLWDTSTEEDINVNLKLVDDVIRTVKAPSLPTIGLVGEMLVSHVSDTGDIYLQTSKQYIGYLETIMSIKMKNSKSPVPVKVKKPDQQKLYVVRSTKTGLYHRAKLIKPLEGNLVSVKFIDYGYEQVVDSTDLLDLEQTSIDLATIPSQVVRAQFATAKPPGIRAIQKVRDQVVDQSVLVKVTRIPVAGSPPLVELLKRSETDGTLSSVNKLLTEDDLQIAPAASTPVKKKSFVVSPENTLSKSLPMPNIPPVGSYFNVIVSLAAHPGHFNVQPQSTQKELMEVMFRLQEKCEKSYVKPLAPSEFKIGELYAVKLPDKFWYRAYAQAFTGSSTFIVCLCDFGNIVETSPEELMPLSGEFKTFPYQAIRAYLAGIAPTNKDWTALECVEFRELVVDRQFSSQIIEINRDGNNPNYISLGLVLVDTSTPEDVYIHKILLDRNMAVLKPREIV